MKSHLYLSLVFKTILISTQPNLMIPSGPYCLLFVPVPIVHPSSDCTLICHIYLILFRAFNLTQQLYPYISNFRASLLLLLLSFYSTGYASLRLTLWGFTTFPIRSDGLLLVVHISVHMLSHSTPVSSHEISPGRSSVIRSRHLFCSVCEQQNLDKQDRPELPYVPYSIFGHGSSGRPSCSRQAVSRFMTR